VELSPAVGPRHHSGRDRLRRPPREPTATRAGSPARAPRLRQKLHGYRQDTNLQAKFAVPLGAEDGTVYSKEVATALVVLAHQSVAKGDERFCVVIIDGRSSVMNDDGECECERSLHLTVASEKSVGEHAFRAFAEKFGAEVGRQMNWPGFAISYFRVDTSVFEFCS
jgi:hypothetical protein